MAEDAAAGPVSELKRADRRSRGYLLSQEPNTFNKRAHPITYSPPIHSKLQHLARRGRLISKVSHALGDALEYWKQQGDLERREIPQELEKSPV